MVDELLIDAVQHADRSQPSIRAAARLRLARVQAVSDPGRARITFEMAVEEAQHLARPEREALFQLARYTAAAIQPDLLSSVPPSSHGYETETLLSIMLTHHRIDAAFDFVMDGKRVSAFPYGYAVNLMNQLDQERRVAVLRRIIEIWRAENDTDRDASQSEFPGFLHGHNPARSFNRVFQAQWKSLPEQEAREIVSEIVRTTLAEPDMAISAGYPDVQITSYHAHALFELLHILRHLEPALAEQLIATHEQLAAAAHRYPNGLETMRGEMERQAEERRRQMAASGQTCTGGFIATGSGSYEELERRRAAWLASQKGDFGPAMEHALDLFREDTNPENPNQAPKAFWPSGSRFRTALYDAGKRIGLEAATLLKSIPDPDLRLLAQIELAAALAGLPAYAETSMKQRRPPNAATRRSPRRVP